MACPPKQTDPDVVLALKANQHKGESYGQKVCYRFGVSEHWA